MREITFYKMQGAGNDFVVIDNRHLQFTMKEIIDFTPELCDRRFGIGADGLMALESPQIDGVDYTMIYRNADGSDAGMCGNGSRCLALFAAHHGFGVDQTFNVHKAIYNAEVNLQNNSVSVGFPDVSEPGNIQIENYQLIQVYTGTEHVVDFVDDDQLKIESELITVGSMLRNHDSLNPPGSNVNFVCKKEETKIELQTYERGVEGLTLACGTGAIASAIATHYSSNEKESKNFDYMISVKGGTLNVSFNYDTENKTYKNIRLAGPANFVFEGKINV